MTDRPTLGTSAAGAVMAETGPIARLLTASNTSPFVREWLSAALDRDPLLAYREAATLVGMLELLSCEEAREWLLPALASAIRQGPQKAFAASLDIAEALRPAAEAIEALPWLPEPANS